MIAIKIRTNKFREALHFYCRLGEAKLAGKQIKVIRFLYYQKMCKKLQLEI